MKKNTSFKIIVLIIMLSVLALSMVGGVLAKYITTLKSETVFTMDVGKRYPTITSNFIDSEEDFTISGSPTAGFKITLKNAPSDFTHVAYNVGTEIKYAEVSDKAFTIETGTQETVTLEKAKMYAFATLDSGLADLKIYNRLNRIATTFTPDNMTKPAHILLLPDGKPSASSDPEGGSPTWRTTAAKDVAASDSNFRVKVKTVTFQDPIQPTSTRWWFNCFRTCSSFTFVKDGKAMLDTSQVTDMGCMFRFCHAVAGLDLSTFDTAKVTDMERMFSENKALTSLKLSGWNTANVTDMASMFWTCSALKELDISHFNTANVTTMYQMFGYSPQLTHLNLSSFQTDKVTTMGKMFVGCTNLRAIKIGSGWKTATTTTNIFQGSAALVYLDGQLGSNTVTYTGWDATNKKANFKVDGYTLENNPSTKPVYTNTCPTGGNATHLAGEVKRSDLTKQVEYGEKLEYTISISSADSGGTWDSHKLTLAPAKMYSYATLPKTATADAPGALNIYYRLNRISTKFKPDNNADADNLKIYNLWDYYYSMISDYANPEGSTAWHLLRNNNEGTNPSPVGSAKAHDTIPFVTCRNLFHRFENCTTIDLTGLDTSKAPDMQSFFNGCVKLTDVNEELLDTSNATNFSAMFANCSLLTELDVSEFITTKVTNMSQMFSGCRILTKLDLSNFDTSKVTSMSMMFNQCNALTSLDITSFKTSNVTAMNNMFQATKLASLDLTHFDTSNVTTMKSMFNSCASLQNVDVSSFNTEKVTDMSYMFKECRSLTKLDISNFKTQNVIAMYNMFINDVKLKTIIVGAGWNTDSVTTSTETGEGSTDMFKGCTKLQGHNGTTYNANIVDKTYARVDGKGGLGYFSCKGHTFENGVCTLCGINESDTLDLLEKEEFSSIDFDFDGIDDTNLEWKPISEHEDMMPYPNEDYQIEFKANEGYKLPDTIKVEIDGTVYNVATKAENAEGEPTFANGILTILAELLTDETKSLVITVSAIPVDEQTEEQNPTEEIKKEFNIDTAGLENAEIKCTSDEDGNAILVIKADEGYTLSETFIITIGDTEYEIDITTAEQEDGIVWDSETGTLTIPKDLVSGENVEIGVKLQAVIKEDDDEEADKKPAEDKNPDGEDDTEDTDDKKDDTTSGGTEGEKPKDETTEGGTGTDDAEQGESGNVGGNTDTESGETTENGGTENGDQQPDDNTTETPGEDTETDTPVIPPVTDGEENGDGAEEGGEETGDGDNVPPATEETPAQPPVTEDNGATENGEENDGETGGEDTNPVVPSDKVETPGEDSNDNKPSEDNSSNDVSSDTTETGGTGGTGGDDGNSSSDTSTSTTSTATNTTATKKNETTGSTDGDDSGDN